MKLNAYFRKELAYIIKWQHEDSAERKLTGKKPIMSEDYLYNRKDEIEKEMVSYGYTSPEIKSLQLNADSLSAMMLYVAHEAEHRKELKEWGCSDMEIEQAVKEASSVVLESHKPFSLNW